MATEPEVRLTVWVRGYVQGVGFRWWTRAQAQQLGLSGYASNQPDGRVLVVAHGPRAVCECLLELLQSGRTPGHVDAVAADWSEVDEPIRGFTAR